MNAHLNCLVTAFQSTLPVWAATFRQKFIFAPCVISIHAARVGSDKKNGIRYEYSAISIHAARVGSDRQFHNRLLSRFDFNPRCPCGQRLRYPARIIQTTGAFQSTLPVWAATAGMLRFLRSYQRFQSTLPVWAATIAGFLHACFNAISIHAARVGSDDGEFGNKPQGQISIHAARVGSDLKL